jgi:hypothetical protein
MYPWRSAAAGGGETLPATGEKMATVELDLAPAETRDIDYVERAQALAPLLEDAADEIEERRQLPERVVEALVASARRSRLTVSLARVRAWAEIFAC